MSQLTPTHLQFFQTHNDLTMGSIQRLRNKSVRTTAVLLNGECSDKLSSSASNKLLCLSESFIFQVRQLLARKRKLPTH